MRLNLDAEPIGAAIAVLSATERRSEIHLEDVEPACEAVDGVDDRALIYEHVVELDRFAGGARRGRGDEGRDLPRLVGIGDVVGAQAAIEEGADNDLVGVPGGRRGRVLEDVVRAEPSAPL